MALRNLVTGSDACASSASNTRTRTNPLSQLADTLFRRTATNQRAEQAGASSSNYGSFFEEVQHEGPSQSQATSSVVQSQSESQSQQWPDILNQALQTEAAAHPHVGFVQNRDFIISETFKRLLDSAQQGVPFAGIQFTAIEFDPLDQQKIKNRVQILCHHVFADHGPDFAQLQASRFLEAIQIDTIPSGGSLFHHQQQPPWTSSSLNPYPTWNPPVGVDWVKELSNLTVGSNTDHVFRENQQKERQEPIAEISKEEVDNVSSALIDQMSRDADPKFRNSKFLEFLKMLNSGEIVINGDQVEHREVKSEQPEAQSSWMDASEQWGMDAGGLEGGWLEQYEIDEWLARYQQMSHGPIYEKKDYQFASNNPHMGQPDALRLAQELFAKGALNEALMAAEAAVQQNSKPFDGWNLLGRIQAEGNNDLQAISAFEQAKALDPSSLQLLLDLGVCHANESNEKEAIEAMMSWLRQHPQHQSHPLTNSTPPDESQMMSHTLNVFHQVMDSSPQEVDIKIALGVLHHLARNFDEAISLFEAALTHRPQDHSLWNKLGATQANKADSLSAIKSYKTALEHKPNYMRAWANLGISYSNVGEYTLSTEHYTRALTLNPNSETVWEYTKTSAICAGLIDLCPAIDNRDLIALRSFFNM